MYQINKERIVFQGSVALGAFEAGVFKKLYEMIKQKDANWKKRMFDIIAGTSAGAYKCCNINKPCKAEKDVGRFSRKN